MKPKWEEPQKYRFGSIALTLFLIFFVFFSNNSVAQNFHFGLKASPSICWIKPDYTGWKSNGIRMGFNYGIMTEFSFSDNYSFATGIEVSHRGGKIEEKIDTSGFNLSTDLTLKLQNVDVPLLIKMKTNEIGYISYFGQFGFTPSINLKAKGDDQVKVNGALLANNSGRDIKSSMQTLSIALVIGIGLEYSLAGKTALLLGINFNNGFSNILTHERINGVDYNYKAVGNYISLNTGILF